MSPNKSAYITARYSANETMEASERSASLTITQEVPQITLTLSSGSVMANQPVKITVALQSPTGKINGTVTLMDGGAILATIPLIDGIAAYETRTITSGVHTIYAIYNGEENFASVASDEQVFKVMNYPIYLPMVTN